MVRFLLFIFRYFFLSFLLTVFCFYSIVSFYRTTDIEHISTILLEVALSTTIILLLFFHEISLFLSFSRYLTLPLIFLSYLFIHQLLALVSSFLTLLSPSLFFVISFSLSDSHLSISSSFLFYYLQFILAASFSPLSLFLSYFLLRLNSFRLLITLCQW